MNKGTIFIDIDGCILKHGDFRDAIRGNYAPPLPGTVDKLFDWHRQGYIIVLTTGRTEPMRDITEIQLCNAGIIYDQLVMGLGPGPRYLINDKNPAHSEVKMATAIELERNVGLDSVNL